MRDFGLQTCFHISQRSSGILRGCYPTMMPILPPLHHHLLQSFDGVQVPYENAPLRPCSPPDRYTAFPSSRAGHYFANEWVVCPNQQAPFLRASQVTAVVEVEDVSLLASQATKFVGVEVATPVALACNTCPVPSPTGVRDRRGVLVLRQKAGMSADSSRCRKLLLLSASSFPSHIWPGRSSFCAKKLEVLLSAISSVESTKRRTPVFM